MKKNKSCKSCSFYITDEDICHLSKEEQIEFENFETKSLDSIENESLIRLACLLQKIRRQTCIGGLVELNEIKENCKYYMTNLSTDFDKNQLLQIFIDNKAKIQYRKNNWISLSLGIVTVIVSVYGVTLNTKNQNLENQVLQLKEESKELKVTITTLQDSISMTNDTLKLKRKTK